MDWFYATLGIGGSLLALRWLFSSSPADETDQDGDDGASSSSKHSKSDVPMRDVGLLGGIMGGGLEEVAGAQFALRYQKARAQSKAQDRRES